MKKLFLLTAMLALVCAGLLTGCQKQETPAAPAPPSTNAPAQ